MAHADAWEGDSLDTSATKLVYIVSDDGSVHRSASRILIHAGYRIMAYFSGKQFLHGAANTDGACVLLDLGLPEMDCMQMKHELYRRHMDLPVVGVAKHCEVSLAVKAMHAGAVTVIGKPYTDEELLAAMKEASVKLGGSSVRVITIDEAKMCLASLTRRERDVLNGLAVGHANKTIAYDLRISPRTVEVYRASMMKKLCVHSLSEALRILFVAEAGAYNNRITPRQLSIFD